MGIDQPLHRKGLSLEARHSKCLEDSKKMRSKTRSNLFIPRQPTTPTISKRTDKKMNNYQHLGFAQDNKNKNSKKCQIEEIKSIQNDNDKKSKKTINNLKTIENEFDKKYQKPAKQLLTQKASERRQQISRQTCSVNYSSLPIIETEAPAGHILKNTSTENSQKPAKRNCTDLRIKSSESFEQISKQTCSVNYSSLPIIKTEAPAGHILKNTSTENFQNPAKRNCTDLQTETSESFEQISKQTCGVNYNSLPFFKTEAPAGHIIKNTSTENFQNPAKRICTDLQTKSSESFEQNFKENSNKRTNQNSKNLQLNLITQETSNHSNLHSDSTESTGPIFFDKEAIKTFLESFISAKLNSVTDFKEVVQCSISQKYDGSDDVDLKIKADLTNLDNSIEMFSKYVMQSHNLNSTIQEQQRRSQNIFFVHAEGIDDTVKVLIDSPGMPTKTLIFKTSDIFNSTVDNSGINYNETMLQTSDQISATSTNLKHKNLDKINSNPKPRKTECHNNRRHIREKVTQKKCKKAAPTTSAQDLNNSSSFNTNANTISTQTLNNLSLPSFNNKLSSSNTSQASNNSSLLATQYHVYKPTTLTPTCHIQVPNMTTVIAPIPYYTYTNNGPTSSNFYNPYQSLHNNPSNSFENIFPTTHIYDPRFQLNVAYLPSNFNNYYSLYPMTGNSVYPNHYPC